MDDPSLNTNICKAKDCTSKRVNENFCGKHTHRWYPVYMRYKNLQDRAMSDLPGTIPDLVKLYGLYAKIYELRKRFRNALDPKYHDSGHVRAIDATWQMMTKIEQKLCSLTSIKPNPQTSHSISEEEIESENDLVDMSPETVIATHVNYEMWDQRIDCLSMLTEMERKHRDRLLSVIEIMIKNNADKLLHGMYGANADDFDSAVKMVQKSTSWIALIPLLLIRTAESVILTNKPYTGKMRFYDHRVSCSSDFRRTIAALGMCPALHRIALVAYIYLFQCTREKSDPIMRYEIRPNGDNIAISLNSVHMHSFSPSLIKEQRYVETHSYTFDTEPYLAVIPRSVFEISVPSQAIICEACEMELHHHEPYKTRFNHISECKIEDLQILMNLILSGKTKGHMFPFRVYHVNDGENKS